MIVLTELESTVFTALLVTMFAAYLTWFYSRSRASRCSLPGSGETVLALLHWLHLKEAELHVTPSGLGHVRRAVLSGTVLLVSFFAMLLFAFSLHVLKLL